MLILFDIEISNTIIRPRKHTAQLYKFTEAFYSPGELSRRAISYPHFFQSSRKQNIIEFL
jgi:hypothetical protein